MIIKLNGQATEVADGLNIITLLEGMELSHRRVAVEVNESIVPKSLHAQYCLQADDRVEIVQAIGGG